MNEDTTAPLEGATDPLDLFARAVAAAIHGNNGDDPTRNMHSEISSGVSQAFQWGIKNDLFRRGVFETALSRPNVIVDKLLDGSGRVVESKTNQWIDQQVLGVFTENEGEFKAFVENYVRMNMEKLMIAALSRILTTLVTEALTGASRNIAGATDAMIRDAFMNVRMQTR